MALGVAQMVERLPSKCKCKALSSNLSIAIIMIMINNNNNKETINFLSLEAMNTIYPVSRHLSRKIGLVIFSKL
jgi:hypothetical protein